MNPRELNPYLKGNGSGYPDDADEKRSGEDQLPSSSLVGDGGASWRLKALKRAQEQAAREGRKLEEVFFLTFQNLYGITTTFSYLHLTSRKCTGCGRTMGFPWSIGCLCSISYGSPISCSSACHKT